MLRVPWGFGVGEPERVPICTGNYSGFVALRKRAANNIATLGTRRA